MALAMIYPTPAKVKRKGSGYSDSEERFSPALLPACRAVLKHPRALADEVIADRMPLDSAIKQMQREREASSSIEAKMDRLREQALADRRDLKTGQKAMWYAFGHRERQRADESGAKGGRGKRGSEPNAFKVARPRISEARKILAHSEALARDVLADRIPLDVSLKTVADAQTRALSVDARKERLRDPATRPLSFCRKTSGAGI
jgi:hypothetical protein